MSLYLRGNTWWIQYFRNGKRVRESSNSEKRKDAEKLLTIRKAESLTGKYIGQGGEKIRMAGLFQMVLDDQKRHGHKDLYNTKKRISKWLIPTFGKMRAGQFGSDHVDKYIDLRREAGAPNSTINRELSIIRRGFTLAMQSDPPKVERVPHIPKLPEQNTRQGFVEHDTYLRIRDSLPGYARLALVIGYHTGARKGEILQLQWSMVDLSAREIRVPETLTKNKKPHVIPIYGEMVHWLQMARDERDANNPGCVWVIHESGRHIGHFRRSWATATKAAGVPDLLFHDLRRSAVRNMERAGIPRSVAMDISGHQTESVYKRYAIVSPRDRKEATAKLERLHAAETPRTEITIEQPQTAIFTATGEGDGTSGKSKRIFGVAGGVRTLGHRNHNPALYQLSYSHRNKPSLTSNRGASRFT
jgi:integrase